MVVNNISLLTVGKSRLQLAPPSDLLPISAIGNVLTHPLLEQFKHARACYRDASLGYKETFPRAITQNATNQDRSDNKVWHPFRFRTKC